MRYNDPFGTAPGDTVEDAYAANISFNAMAGRVYRVQMDNNNSPCIKISEVSHDVELLTCEPATRLDELIGRKGIYLRDL